MTVFMIDQAAEAELKALAERAARHVISYSTLLHAVGMMKAGTPITILPQDQTIVLPTGFVVTYSVEEQANGQNVRHMSMSSPARGRAPIPAACEMVMEHLGFPVGFAACQVWLEDIGGGEKAVNVAAPWSVN